MRLDNSTAPCVGECLRRVALIKQSRWWTQAKRLKPREKGRSELFKRAIKHHGFSEYDLHAYICTLRNSCWLSRHIDANTAQKVATRAYRAANGYLRGKRGKPRFKSYGRLRSLEGKSNQAGIRFKEGLIVWNIRGGESLQLQPLYDPQDKHAVQAHALSCKTKYVRLVCKTIRKKERWYAQLVQEGSPKVKRASGQGVVGLDIGPSSIAAVSGKRAFLKPFCQDLVPQHQKCSKLQRCIERSRRQTNPQNYQPDGTIKLRPKQWVRSKNYQNIRLELAEEQRKLAATRKTLHGQLANQIFAMGNQVQLEKLNYRQFQQKYGKSVGLRAPGSFVEILRRKAESAGGQVCEFSTYKTRLSQTCHCGRTTKKPLHQRWHRCSCGAHAQRDLFSAHLARFVHNDRLDTCQAKTAWTAAGPLLEQAVSRLNQSANRRGFLLASFGLSQRQSRSLAKEGSLPGEAADVVGDKLRAAESLLVCP